MKNGQLTPENLSMAPIGRLSVVGVTFDVPHWSAAVTSATVASVSRMISADRIFTSSSGRPPPAYPQGWEATRLSTITGSRSRCPTGGVTRSGQDLPRLRQLEANDACEGHDPLPIHPRVPGRDHQDAPPRRRLEHDGLEDLLGFNPHGGRRGVYRRHVRSGRHDLRLQVLGEDEGGQILRLVVHGGHGVAIARGRAPLIPTRSCWAVCC
jgi:hypothetical protein